MKCYIIVDPYGRDLPLKANSTAQVRTSERSVKHVCPSCLNDGRM
jgi:hypothetical protein